MWSNTAPPEMATATPTRKDAHTNTHTTTTTSTTILSLTPVQWIAVYIAALAMGVALRCWLTLHWCNRVQLMLWCLGVGVAVALYVRQSLMHIPYGVLEPLIWSIVTLPFLLVVLVGTLVGGTLPPSFHAIGGATCIAIVVACFGYIAWSRMLTTSRLQRTSPRLQRTSPRLPPKRK